MEWLDIYLQANYFISLIYKKASQLPVTIHPQTTASLHILNKQILLPDCMIGFFLFFFQQMFLLIRQVTKRNLPERQVLENAIYSN